MEYIKMSRNYFQDCSDLVSLWIPSTGKTKTMCSFTTKASGEVSWGGKQLPPASLCSFPGGYDV